MVQASLLVALSGILYGLMGFLGSKIIDNNISVSSMLFWRFFIAGLWMLPFALQQNLGQSLKSLDKRLLLFMLLLGPLGYAGASGFYFMACAYTGTGLSMVIFFSYPIIVVLFGWLTQKYQPKFMTFFMLVAMSIGLALLRDSTEDSIDILGILFGLAAAASYAFYMIGSKKYATQTIHSNILAMLISFSCAFIFLILALVNHNFTVPDTQESWVYLFSLGVLVTALPIQLMLQGLKKISSIRASIISVLEPIVTVLIGMALLNESISVIQFLGVGLVLGSAILVQFQRDL